MNPDKYINGYHGTPYISDSEVWTRILIPFVIAPVVLIGA